MINLKYGNLTFQEAIDYFRSKSVLTPDEFNALMEAQKSRAFTVSGLADKDLLTDIKALIEQSLKGELTYQQFKTTLPDTLAKYGWSFGDKTAWRSDIIYNTNTAAAYANGRAKQQADPELLKLRPFLQYCTMGDTHVRPEHAAWNGIIKAADDPWWNSHTPYVSPGDWYGCRCWRKSLTATEAGMAA